MNNYIQRSLTTPGVGPFGGNLSVSKWTLGSLFEQWQLHHNVWNRTNKDLDLVTYHGTKIKFWRNPQVDYIVTYSRNGPFNTSLYTHAAGQPFVMLLSRHRIVVPSLKTKPKGKPYKRLYLKPPRMLTQKFYFQSDFCPVGLFHLVASACNLQDPWMDPHVISPIVTFYCLKPSYYDKQDLQKTTEQNTALQDKTWFKEIIYNDWLERHWGDIVPTSHEEFTPSLVEQKITEIKTGINNQQTKAKQTYDENYKFIFGSTRSDTVSKELSWEYGIYSPLYLWPDPIFPETTTAYMEVRYNPGADKGIGNWIAIQPLTKDSANQELGGILGLLKDYPMWALCYGYSDLLQKLYPTYQPMTSYRVIMRCPYTKPPLAYANPADYSKGYTIFDHNFATGRTPGGEVHIPILEQFRWYPKTANQLPVLEAIANCGPLMPRDGQQKGWTVTMGYKAKFTLGGNPIPRQDPVDPCNVSKRPLPDPDKQLGGVQVVDPALMDPTRLDYPWDYRRGLLTTRALKRGSEYSGTDPFVYPGASTSPKIPRNDVSIQGDAERQEQTAYGVLRSLLQEQHSEEETQDPPRQGQGSQAEPQLILELELQRQRLRQGKLQKGVLLMLEQLIKTQQGAHLDPRLL